MEDGDKRVSRHGFSQLWVGPKWFLFMAAMVVLTILIAAAWFLSEHAPLPAGGFLGRALLYPMAAVYGLLHGSAVLLSLWFFGYFFQEVKEMIAELYKERRFQEGLAQGRTEGQAEGRTERDREWTEYLARQAAAAREGVPFAEPTPAERAAKALD